MHSSTLDQVPLAESRYRIGFLVEIEMVDGLVEEELVERRRLSNGGATAEATDEQHRQRYVHSHLNI